MEKHLLELGRCPSYEGPEDQRPDGWTDETPPDFRKAGESDVPPELKAALPFTLDGQERAWMIDVFGPDVLTLHGNGAVLLDLRANGRRLNAVVCWITRKTSVNPLRHNVEGKTVTRAYGFVELSDESRELLFRALRAAAASAAEEEVVDCAIRKAWHGARLEPDQVEWRRAQLLKANGLDDATVADQRAAIAHAIRFERAANKKNS